MWPVVAVRLQRCRASARGARRITRVCATQPIRRVRQLGHSNLGITSVYLQGIDNAEIIDTVHARRAPMISVNALLRL